MNRTLDNEILELVSTNLRLLEGSDKDEGSDLNERCDTLALCSL